MPELPEVETVRRGLAPVMEGAVIVNAAVYRPDLRWPFPPQMAERLTGQSVTALRRRSKYILVDLSSGETLIIHLGMSGRMLVSGQMLVSGKMLGDFHHAPQIRPVSGDHPAPAKHDHVVLDMDNGARVTFNDARRFGAMDLSATQDLENHWLIRDIGPEPLGNAFSEITLKQRLKNRATPIKTALLDQKNVAGLGNIYVCEILHRAGINPTSVSGKLSGPRVASLVPIIRQVLTEAIDAGGSSLRDYRQTDGELGYFQHTFRVYDREGQPCTTCATPIGRIVQSGRSTFYCPSCQK